MAHPQCHDSIMIHTYQTYIIESLTLTFVIYIFIYILYRTQPKRGSLSSSWCVLGRFVEGSFQESSWCSWSALG